MLIAVSGEAAPDGELADASTVPAGIVADAHRYLVAGGADNLGQLLRFVADTTQLGGFGFAAPVPIPDTVVWDGAGLGVPGAVRRPDRPLVGIVFYRAHLVAGNTTFVGDLAAAIDAAGGDAVAVACYSLRPDTGPAGGGPPATRTVAAIELLREHGIDCLVTTVLAMGGSTDEEWDAGELASLGVPVLHAPTPNRSSAAWACDEAGLTPLEVASGVAMPEFDGRIIVPAFAFKEIVDDGTDGGSPLIASRTIPDRVQRVAELAVRHARLRAQPPAERRVAIVMTAYPTKGSRLGNAVGLDTPASVIGLLDRLAAEGYRVDRQLDDSDALMAELAAGLTYETPQLSGAQVAGAVGALDADRYRRWFATLPDAARDEVVAMWGEAPGEVYLHDGALHFPGIDLGNVLVTVQPPRGFGADPIGTYHAPDMPPPHHYLAFYRWLDEMWGADVIVHAGKHGTLEWLPGKANAPSAGCFPDAAIGAVPLVYPFLVNDPGEGAQAKRRVHATIVDHLPPPMTRAETYGDLAKLEQLLDAYANVQAMDPAKLPAIRGKVWEVLVAAEMHTDLGLDAGARRRDVRRHGARGRRLSLRAQGRPDPVACTCSASRRPGASRRRRVGHDPARQRLGAVAAPCRGGATGPRSTGRRPGHGRARSRRHVAPRSRRSPPTAGSRSPLPLTGSAVAAMTSPVGRWRRRCGGSVSASCRRCGRRPTRSITCSTHSPGAMCRPDRAGTDAWHGARAAHRPQLTPSIRNRYPRHWRGRSACSSPIG